MKQIVTAETISNYELRRRIANGMGWIGGLLIFPGLLIGGATTGRYNVTLHAYDGGLYGSLVCIAMGIVVCILAYKAHPAHSKHPQYILIARWVKLINRPAKEFPYQPLAILAMKQIAFEALCREALKVRNAFLYQEEAHKKLKSYQQTTPQAATWESLPAATQSLEYIENCAKMQDDLAKTRKEIWLQLFDFFTKIQPDGIGVFPELIGKADEFRIDPTHFQSILLPQPVVLFSAS